MTYSHVVLLISTGDAREARYSRHATGLTPEEVWSYHSTAVEALEGSCWLIAVFDDPDHEHPAVWSQGKLLHGKHMP